MYRFGVLLIVGLVTANDLAVGPTNVGRKIYDEHKGASPAIWRQVHNVTINATADEIINSISIVDNRPEKDGEANIVDGGIGHQNVTIELKSPAVFRGYDFQIQAYAVPISEFKGVLPEHKVSSTPSSGHVETSSRQVPILTATDLEKTTIQVRNNDDESSTTENAKTSTDKPEQQPKTLQDEQTKTEKTPSQFNHERDVLKFLTHDNKPLSTDVIESTAFPTTEDDAQMIDGKDPAILNQYPPKTHEEQGNSNAGDSHEESTTLDRNVSKTTVQYQPIPTVFTKNDHSTPAPKVNQDTKHTNAVNRNQQEPQRQKNEGMMPLPYINQ